MYVTEHLPDALFKQMKLLMPQAKLNKQNAYWRVENEDYVLYIDEVRHCAVEC